MLTRAFACNATRRGYNPGMRDWRWIVLGAVLGLAVAYVLWGRRSPAAPTIADTQAAPTEPAQKAAPLQPTGITSRLKLTPAELDLGEVLVNEERTVDVVIENPHDRPVAIKDLHGSCSCTQPTLTAPLIAPGGRETLHVIYIGLFGRQADVVSVFFTTTEVGAPQVRLEVHAHVKQEFSLEPETLQFDRLAKGESKTLEAVVRQLEGQPFKIENIVSSGPQFSFQWTPVADGGDAAYKIAVTATGTKSGAASDTAGILTDHPRIKRIPMSLAVSVSFDVACNPRQLVVSAGEDGRAPPFEALLKRTTPGKLEVLTVTETRKLALTYETTRVDDTTVQISIRLTQPAPRRAPYGQFLIQTNADDEPLPVAYRVRPRGDAGAPEEDGKQ
jgi:hypothetical protein